MAAGAHKDVRCAVDVGLLRAGQPRRHSFGGPVPFVNFGTDGILAHVASIVPRGGVR
jgi:hypothetical protein